MATFTKSLNFTYDLGTETHNFTADTLTLALTNTTPNTAWDELSDLTQVSYTNLSSRTLTTTSWTTSSGVAKLVIADKTLTASGGSVGPFRYIYVYNDSSTNDRLIGYLDIGQSITLNSGQSFVVDFDASAGGITI